MAGQRCDDSSEALSLSFFPYWLLKFTYCSVAMFSKILWVVV